MRRHRGMETWVVTCVGGRVFRIRGATPEHAARRVVKMYFGWRARARRIVGSPGGSGAFEVIGRRGNPLTAFDVDGMA